MVWYAAHYPQVNLAHLEQWMRQSRDYPDVQPLTLSCLHKFLLVAAEDADIEILKQDVRPFVRDPQELELWSKDFCRQMVMFFVSA